MKKLCFWIAVSFSNHYRLHKLSGWYVFSGYVFFWGCIFTLIDAFKSQWYTYLPIILSGICLIITKSLLLIEKKFYKPYVIINGRYIVPNIRIEHKDWSYRPTEYNDYKKSLSDLCKSCLFKANCRAALGNGVVQCDSFVEFKISSDIDFWS